MIKVMGGCVLHKDAAWMRQQYVDEGLSTYQIAELISVPKTNIEYWLKKHGIQTRSRATVNKLRAKVPGDDGAFLEKLQALYHDEKQTIEQIATAIGMSKTQTCRLLRKAGATMRNSGDYLQGTSWSSMRKRPNKKTDVLSAEILHNLYHAKGLSTYTIAEMYGTQANKILARMRELEVPTRRQVESIWHRFDATNHITIDGHLQQVLDGELLGDGCLHQSSERSASFTYGTSQKAYADWLISLLASLGLDTGRTYERTIQLKNGQGKHCNFHSRAYPELLQYREYWYPDNVKRVPQDLQLTPTMCRHWYIGDGHLNRRGGFINIATQSFPREEVEFLAEQLRRQIGDVRLWKSQFGHGWVIGILKRFVPAFLEFIGPCPEPILPVYGYKWGVTDGP